jgi:hypothetical protein
MILEHMKSSVKKTLNTLQNFAVNRKYLKEMDELVSFVENQKNRKPQDSLEFG